MKYLLFAMILMLGFGSVYATTISDITSIFTGNVNITGNLSLNNGAPEIFIDGSNGRIQAGNQGFETNGVNINGATLQSVFRANDIGGNELAEMVLHKHSSTIGPAFLGARSNSDNDTHGNITANDNVLRLIGTGWTGSHYDLFSEISFAVDDKGTVSTTSSPGSIVFKTTSTGSNTPIIRGEIDSDGILHWLYDLNISGNIELNASNINGVYYANTISELTSALSVLTNGGRIIIGNGVYDISSSISISQNNITVEAYGATFRLGDNDSATGMFRITGKNVHILGGTFIGNKDRNSTDVSDIGIYILGTEYVTIKDTIQLSHNNHGIRADNSSYIMYSNNYVNHTSWMGLEFFNTIHSKMIGNTVIGSQGQNIELSTDADYNLISDNTLYLSGGNAIELFNSDYNTVSNNLIKDTGNLTPINSALPGGHGIDIDGDYNIIQGNTITDGVRDGSYQGINTNGHTGNKISGNTIDVSSRGFYGIYLRDSTNLSLDSNKITANEHPIRIRMTQNARISGHTLICTGASDDGIRIDDDTVTNSSYLAITGLQVLGSCVYAINEVGSGNYFLVDGIDASLTTSGVNVAAANIVVGDVLS